jgi:uncharacterized protein YecE (DUF72 family)
VRVSAFAGGVLNSQEITHEKNLVDAEAETESFIRAMAELGNRLGPLLLQRGAALRLIDYPRMPRMDEATADFSYIRWLGDRREFPAGHTRFKKERDDDLGWWSDLVGRFLEEGRTVFAYANNHYQNHSPSTLARFLEIRRGER